MLLQTRKKSMCEINQTKRKKEKEKMNKKKHRRKTEYEKNTQKKNLLMLSFWQTSKMLQ